MEQRITYVGLMCTKMTIGGGACWRGKRGELLRVWQDREHAGGVGDSGGEAGESWLAPSICYEAGPCGYGIQRQLSEAGHECVVVVVPRR